MVFLFPVLTKLQGKRDIQWQHEDITELWWSFFRTAAVKRLLYFFFFFIFWPQSALILILHGFKPPRTVCGFALWKWMLKHNKSWPRRPFRIHTTCAVLLNTPVHHVVSARLYRCHLLYPCCELCCFLWQQFLIWCFKALLCCKLCVKRSSHFENAWYYYFL